MIYDCTGLLLFWKIVNYYVIVCNLQFLIAAILDLASPCLQFGKHQSGFSTKKYLRKSYLPTKCPLVP